MEIEKKIPLGASVTDYQLSQANQKEILRIKELLAEHGVLLFHNQDLNDQEFVIFLEKLGPMMFTTGERSVDNAPMLNVLSNVGRATKPKSNFHSDSTYFKKPPAYTALRAIQLPDTGGETLFANQYRSYETLPNDIKQQLKGKKFTH